ncbi:MAG: hypothetical protein AAGI69_13680 [Cyanobacteria bacterium P01_H01_bin.21]
MALAKAIPSRIAGTAGVLKALVTICRIAIATLKQQLSKNKTSLFAHSLSYL